MAKGKNHYRRGRRSRKRGFGAWSLGKKIGVILGGTVALVAATGAVILASKLSKIEKVPIDPMELSVSEEARVRGTGYLNVALFGVDSRKNELGKGTRSDTIMIASLNRETLEVKISSVFRDTLLEQDDKTINKANAAYSYGGPEEAVAMLNKNLDMDIEHYVSVNFDALIDVVDEVGGIEIDVTEEEIPYICGYAIEIMKSTGRVSAGVTEPGPQILNGLQATAYARIRYTAGDDFKRAERQRMVLAKIVEKLQQASPAQLNRIIDKVFPEVATNFTMAEILDYAKDAFDYRLGETTGFPFDKTTDELVDVGSVVIPVTLESNVEMLHKFFYGDSDSYSVSSTVSAISDKIVSKAGHREPMVNESTQEIMNQPDDDDYDDDYDYNGGSSSGGGSWGSGSGTSSGGGSGGSTGGGTGSTGGGNNWDSPGDDGESDTPDISEPSTPDEPSSDDGYVE